MADETKNGKKEAKYYERIGRSVESVFESGYSNRGRVYRINFFRGIAFGLGSTIGATIIVALVLYLLSFFNEVPWIESISEAVKNSIGSGE